MDSKSSQFQKTLWKLKFVDSFSTVVFTQTIQNRSIRRVSPQTRWKVAASTDCQTSILSCFIFRRILKKHPDKCAQILQ